MPPAERRSGRRVTVYEARNPARRELFIGATRLSMSELIAGFRERLPPEVAHWPPREPVQFRSLEFGLSPGRAAAFIRRQEAGPESWRVIKALPR